jgi:hypothetical protein
MKLYQTPGGTWAGSEKDWSDAMKAEGLSPKAYKDRKTVEVPTSKAALMEFLTFHNVNVVNPAPVAAPQPPLPPARPPEATTASQPLDLDDLFEAAPLAQQLHLASLACENARSAIR